MVIGAIIIGKILKINIVNNHKLKKVIKSKMEHCDSCGAKFEIIV